MKIEIIEIEIKKILSPKRYEHSLRVADKMKELAEIYHLDVEIASIIGLVHDIAKEMTDEELINYTTENKIEIDYTEKLKPTLLHGKVGADIACKKWNITPEMKDAIIYHTTGKKEMSTLGKILFIADKIEDGRKNINPELQTLAKTNLDVTLKYLYTQIIQKSLQKDSILHLLTIEARNELIKMQKEKTS